MLRKRYDRFLGDIYYPDNILARTTDFDRTKMTALLVLAGLYPPAPIQQWNDDLDWMPIPYHFERGEHDYVSHPWTYPSYLYLYRHNYLFQFIRRPTAYCPNYLKELEKVLVSNEVQRILKENRKILQYISKHTGKSITKLIDVFGLYQTLNAEESMGLALPKWTETVYPDIIHSLASKQCAFENNNTLLKRLHGGKRTKTTTIADEFIISCVLIFRTDSQKGHREYDIENQWQFKSTRKENVFVFRTRKQCN